MKISSAEFVKSSTRINQCPDPDRHEYAFIGRSNVGKSSLINMLVSKKNMAKTSGKPGKTTLINHFVVNQDPDDATTGWYLVDLPGYGYASTSKTDRSKWANFSREYLRRRTNLMTLFLLIDSRHSPQKIDLEFINWCGEEGIPFQIVFTKVDKLSKGALSANLQAYKNKLHESWEHLPPIHVTSSELKRGREELLNFIEQTNEIELG